MVARMVALFFFLMYFFNGASAGDFVKTEDGVIVHPDTLFAPGIKEVRLRVLSEEIIRVIAAGDKKMPDQQSLSVLFLPLAKVNWKLSSTNRTVTIRTPKLVATVDLQTGAVSFFDAAGKKLLNEAPGGRSLKAAVFEGKSLYRIEQRFETSP